MDARSLLILKHMFGMGAALAGVLAAWFGLRDILQTATGREEARESYRTKWEAIRDSRVLDLPELVICWVVRVLPVGIRIVTQRFLQGIAGSDALRQWLMALTVIFVVGAGVTLGEWVGAAAALGLLSAFPDLYRRDRSQLPLSQRDASGIFFAFSGIAVAGGVVCVWGILGIDDFDCPVRLKAAIISVISVYLAFWLGAITDSLIQALYGRLDTPRTEDSDRWASISASLAVSFPVTMLALVIGEFAVPQAHVPDTFQMVLTNVVCDGLTLYATFVILGRAIRSPSRSAIPFAVLLDLAVAAGLACISLFIGRYGPIRDYRLHIGQVVQVLCGLSLEPKRPGFELGPSFWAMHTAFIPTVAYLSLIMFCWIGKVIVLPFAALFSKGSVMEKPYQLTAGALGFIAAVLGAISYAVGCLEAWI